MAFEDHIAGFGDHHAFTVDLTGTPLDLFHVETATDFTTAGQTLVGVTDTSVARTITLSTADVIKGRVIIIKDQSGGANTNNITIDTEGSETIDGAASITIIVDYGVLRIYSNGTNWFSF